MEAHGEAIPDGSWRGMRYEFKKDTYTLWAGATTPAGIAGKPPMQGPYAVSNEQDPHHFNFAMIAGESRRDVEAIYKIVDGKLYLCLGRERPKSFETKDTTSSCYILERVRAAAEK